MPEEGDRGAHLDVVGVLVVVGRVEDDLLRGLRRDVAGRHGAHAAASAGLFLLDGELAGARGLLACGAALAGDGDER